MKHQPNNLIQELKSAGATDSEVKGLLPIADSLKQMKTSNSSLPKSLAHSQPHGRWKILIPIGITSVAGIVVGMAMVILSQSVLPGSLLYPVQKLSDNVAMSMAPSYRGIVMMKRAQQVRQLINNHADSNIVLATLADYQTEASSYKSNPTNYATFDYCKSNLQQAAAAAPNYERQAINKTLESLSDV
jgi:hypothetical protein